jgi:hypothetical protein
MVKFRIFGKLHAVQVYNSRKVLAQALISLGVDIKARSCVSKVK